MRPKNLLTTMLAGRILAIILGARASEGPTPSEPTQAVKALGLCLFDYDGTANNIKANTAKAVAACRAKGYELGVLTNNPTVDWDLCCSSNPNRAWPGVGMCASNGTTCNVERRLWFHKTHGAGPVTNAVDTDANDFYSGHAAESSDPDRNGKVAVMRWVYKRGLVDNPRAIVLWDDNESNAAAVRDSEFSIVFVSARGGRAAHAGIQEYDVACFEAASTDGVSDACGHFS